MPLNDEEKLAYDLLRTLNADDLAAPLESIPKVLAVFEQVKAPLQAQIDEARRQKEARDRAQLISTLVHTQCISQEDATRFVDEKHPYDMEYGPCRRCEGTGSLYKPGCIGGSFEDCPSCDRRRSSNRLRLRLPWDPHGDVAIPMSKAKLTDLF